MLAELPWVWKDAPKLRKFPNEFKRDLVAVARRSMIPIPEVVADFGVAEETVRRWMHPTDVDEGVKEGVTTTE